MKKLKQYLVQVRTERVEQDLFQITRKNIWEFVSWFQVWYNVFWLMRQKKCWGSRLVWSGHMIILRIDATG